MKRRVICILSTVLLTGIITGCTDATDMVKTKLYDYCIEKSGIKEDDSYNQYQELLEEGKLNEEGIYYVADTILNEGTEEETRPAQIFVTFSNNEYLDVSYYTDSEKQNMVVDSCYMNPNDSLYATYEVNSNAKSNLYGFDSFRIYSYDEASGMTILNWEEQSGDCVFQIPSDFKGSEISVVPVGKYKDREIKLNDYQIDNNGNEVKTTGQWFVNNESTNDDSILTNPVSTYTVSYEFDSNEYFLVSTNPVARYVDASQVIFNEENSKSTTTEYNVEIHPYITIGMTVNQDWTYSINDGNETEVKKGKNTTIEGLKYNDIITIKTKKEADLTFDQKDYLSDVSKAELDDGFIYTFSVKEKNASFCFDPTKYTYEHGTLIFKCRGQILTETTYIGEGSQIDYEADTVEEGYWLPDGNKRQ
jgi:hypothetical protein